MLAVFVMEFCDLYSSGVVLIAATSCQSDPPMQISRNGEMVLASKTTNDWIAQRVESSHSFQQIVARYPHVPRRYHSVWYPGWDLRPDSETNEEAIVDIGAPLNQDFWHRWETLRVHRSGKVEREEMRADGELIWVQDK